MDQMIMGWNSGLRTSAYLVNKRIHSMTFHCFGKDVFGMRGILSIPGLSQPTGKSGHPRWDMQPNFLVNQQATVTIYFGQMAKLIQVLNL